MMEAIWSTRHRTDAVGTSAESPEADVPFKVLHALHRSMETLAMVSPVAIVIDDLHLVDMSSTRWLLHLARRVAGMPVVVLAAVADDVDHETTTLLSELQSVPNCQVVQVQPLGREAVTRVVARYLHAEPEAEFTTTCHEVSGGNPLVLRETLRALASRSVLPSAKNVDVALEMGVQARCEWVLDVLRAQSGEVIQLAQVLAVLGSGTELSVAADVGSVGTTVASRSVMALDQLGVLVPGTLEFAHSELAEAVVRDMAASQRVRVHQRAARSLGDRGAPVEVVASHLLAAGPPEQPEMVAVLREASSNAVERGAPDLAVAYLRHALTGRWDNDLHIALLTALILVERSFDPWSAWEHLVRLLRLMATPLQRARTAVGLFPLVAGTGTAELVELLEDSLRQLDEVTAGGEPENDELRTRLLGHVICVAMGDLDGMTRLKPRIDALDEPSRSDTPGQCALVAVHAFLAALGGEWEAASAVELATRAMRDDLLLRDELLHPMFLSALAVLQLAEQFDLVTASYDLGICKARAHNQPMTLMVLRGARFQRGNVPGALVDAQAVLKASSDGHRVGDPLLSVATAVGCLGELGRWHEASRLLDALSSASSANSYLWGPILAARAQVYEGLGDHRAALEQLLSCGRLLSSWNIHNEAYLPWRGRAALLHHRLGERAEAQRLAEEALKSAQRWGSDGAVGSALRVLGVVEGGAKGLVLLRRAVSHGERSPVRLELAKALVELGCAQHAADDDEVARKTLRRGLDLATQCGAVVLAARARLELIAAGGRPRRTRLSGAKALTPAETQVVSLAARGISNDEIAHSLFVTQRTVEFHLTNSYRKLGLSERSQLIDVVEPAERRGVVEARPHDRRDGP